MTMGIRNNLVVKTLKYMFKRISVDDGGVIDQHFGLTEFENLKDYYKKKKLKDKMCKERYKDIEIPHELITGEQLNAIKILKKFLIYKIKTRGIKRETCIPDLMGVTILYEFTTNLSLKVALTKSGFKLFYDIKLDIQSQKFLKNHCFYRKGHYLKRPNISVFKEVEDIMKLISSIFILLELNSIEADNFSEIKEYLKTLLNNMDSDYGYNYSALVEESYGIC